MALPVISRAYHSSSVVALFVTLDGIPDNLSGAVPDAARFSVTVDSSPAVIAEVTVDGNRVFLRMATPIATSANVSVAYSDPVGDQSSGVLQIEDGTDVVSTSQPLTSALFPISRTEALGGAVFGVSFIQDFPEGDYFNYPDESDPPRLVVVASGANSFMVKGTTQPLLANPKFDPASTSGYTSFRYAGDYFLIEIRKTPTLNPAAGTVVDLFDAIQLGSGYDVLSYTVGATVSNSPDGSNPQVFELVKTSFGGSSLPLYVAVNGVIWSDDDVTGSPLADVMSPGSFGNDTLRGMGGNDSLAGGQGNDSLDGGSGADTLSGGPGRDTLNGGTLTDTVQYSDGNSLTYFDSPAAVVINMATGQVVDGFGSTDAVSNFSFISGTRFNDTIFGSREPLFESFAPGLGDDYVDGGELSTSGTNRINYGGAQAAVVVNLATGQASGGHGSDTLVNINDVRGTNFSDALTGSDRSDFREVFSPLGGNDTVDGAGGADQVRYDRDALRGVNVNLTEGWAIDNRDGTDVLLNIEDVRGTPFDDQITGSTVANKLNGGAGDDFLDGRAGIDTAFFDSPYGQAAVSRSPNGLQVTTPIDGSDTLVDVERLQFADRKLAFDIDGNAGSAALIIGAVLGRSAVASPQTVSVVMGLLDSGETADGICDLVVSSGLFAALAGGASNLAFAQLLSRNLLNTNPDSALVSGIAAILDAGLFSQSELLSVATNLSVNRASVGLTGLANTGLEFA